MGEQTFRRMFSSVTEEFRAELPARLAVIDALWARISGDAGSPEPVRELIRELHSIAGSAAIFKLPEVGQAAAAAEAALEPWRHAATAPDADARRDIAGLIAALHGSCNAQSNDGM